MSNLNLSEHQRKQIAQIVQKELDKRYAKLLWRSERMPFCEREIVLVADVQACFTNDFAFSVLKKLRE